MTHTITYDDFLNVDFRVGRVIEFSDFAEAKKPVYKLKIDLGSEIGVKNSSAQITHLYTKEELIGKQVVCVVNFAPKKIGPFISEVLTTGFDSEGGVVLTTVDKKVENGKRLY